MVSVLDQLQANYLAWKGVQDEEAREEQMRGRRASQILMAPPPSSATFIEPRTGGTAASRLAASLRTHRK